MDQWFSDGAVRLSAGPSAVWGKNDFLFWHKESVIPLFYTFGFCLNSVWKEFLCLKHLKCLPWKPETYPE